MIGAWLRCCDSCGWRDYRARWSSAGQAEAAGAFDEPWLCRRCPSVQFELINVDVVAAGRARLSRRAGRRERTE